MVETTYRRFSSVLKAKRSSCQGPWLAGIMRVLHKSDIAKRRPWARTVTAISFAFFLSVPPVAAADREMTQEYLTCLEKSNGVTAEMINCILAETRRQDARLNENYKRLISKLATERKNALVEAHQVRSPSDFHHEQDAGEANCTLRHNVVAEGG